MARITTFDSLTTDTRLPVTVPVVLIDDSAADASVAVTNDGLTTVDEAIDLLTAVITGQNILE